MVPAGARHLPAPGRGLLLSTWTSKNVAIGAAQTNDAQSHEFTKFGDGQKMHCVLIKRVIGYVLPVWPLIGLVLPQSLLCHPWLQCSASQLHSPQIFFGCDQARRSYRSSFSIAGIACANDQASPGFSPV